MVCTFFVFVVSSPDECLNIVIDTLFLHFLVSIVSSKARSFFLSILFLVLDTFPPVCHVTVFLKTGSFQVLFTFFIFVWTSMN